MPDPIKLGDTVAFSKAFFDRHGRYYSRIIDAHGTVTALHRLKTGAILADIDWNTPGFPSA